MKGLDTSVILGLLEGDPAARSLVSRLRGVELATTEANLLELLLVGVHGSARSRKARREVLDRLRQKLTVLSIDSRGGASAARHLESGEKAPPPLVLAMLGALEANGCDELFVLGPTRLHGRWRFKVTRIGTSKPK